MDAPIRALLVEKAAPYITAGTWRAGAVFHFYYDGDKSQLLGPLDPDPVQLSIRFRMNGVVVFPAEGIRDSIQQAGDGVVILFSRAEHIPGSSRGFIHNNVAIIRPDTPPPPERRRTDMPDSTPHDAKMICTACGRRCKKSEQVSMVVEGERGSLATFCSNDCALPFMLRLSSVPTPSSSPAIGVTPGCVVCGRFEAKCKRCGRCRDVYYCSIDCQRLHWPTHKTECKRK